MKEEQELLALLYKKAARSENPYYFVEVNVDGIVKTLVILNPAMKTTEVTESLAAVKATREATLVSEKVILDPKKVTR